ncbi:hypothetical protein KUM42_01105 [Modestobacter sp. L9-4]|jgi:hypothetical protein|uniref:hypothetical protein n=1 Tax=Modestobacter sp. L9-4 TaxID=2851567 RepID=UPI001C7590A0|nr:hypothetical protein [Modestobacter sp. L9-4]QXG76203.1 hypothetical protein KUM42_01105 [Modestobacter sp. L9-4]
MAVNPTEPDRTPDGSTGRIPKNRARALIIGTFVLIVVVIFAYMLLVGLNA